MDTPENAGATYPEVVVAKKLKKGATLLEYYSQNYQHSSLESWKNKILQHQIQVGIFGLSRGLNSQMELVLLIVTIF